MIYYILGIGFTIPISEEKAKALGKAAVADKDARVIIDGNMVRASSITGIVSEDVYMANRMAENKGWVCEHGSPQPAGEYFRCRCIQMHKPQPEVAIGAGEPEPVDLIRREATLKFMRENMHDRNALKDKEKREQFIVKYKEEYAAKTQD